MGLVCTCSGPFGTDVKAAAEVYQAWANSVNSTGGLQGHQVQVTLDDDAGTPGTSLSDAQALIANHVDVLVDNSIVDETWAADAKTAGIPVVGANETEVPFYTNSDFFPEGQTNDSVTYANVATAKAAGVTTLGDLYCAEAVSCQEGVAPIKAAGKTLGVADVFNAEISATAPSYTSQCLAAQQAHTGALFIGDEAFVIARVGTNCDQQGFDPVYVTEGEGFSELLDSAPGVKDKLWSEYGNLPFFANSPAMQAMNTAVDKSYPGLRSNVNQWSEEAAEAWSSGLLLADAVKASGIGTGGAPSPAAITKGLEALKGDTLQGTAPALTFAPGKPHPVDCWFTGRLVNGVPTVANNGHTTCEK